MGLKLCKALMIQFKSVPFQVPLNKRYAKAKGSFIPYMHENWWENRADFISVDICAWKHQFSCASVMFSIHTNVDVSFFFLCAENCIHVDPCAEKKICTWCQCSGVNMEHREQCFFFFFFCALQNVCKKTMSAPWCEQGFAVCFLKAAKVCDEKPVLCQHFTEKEPLFSMWKQWPLTSNTPPCWMRALFLQSTKLMFPSEWKALALGQHSACWAFAERPLLPYRQEESFSTGCSGCGSFLKKKKKRTVKL